MRVEILVLVISSLVVSTPLWGQDSKEAERRDLEAQKLALTLKLAETEKKLAELKALPVFDPETDLFPGLENLRKKYNPDPLTPDHLDKFIADLSAEAVTNQFAYERLKVALLLKKHWEPVVKRPDGKGGPAISAFRLEQWREKEAPKASDGRFNVVFLKSLGAPVEYRLADTQLLKADLKLEWEAFVKVSKSPTKK